ncbi:hypothetical protein MKZ38_002216 [Zalerion maritima]|uniref:STI1 domain-containing protein n=1 Tax=Zalerion maritima TaxID=339359 RepID=A0AAD5RQL2_9PEZI|nr:hypothetical protein MKZ38_002216 [Zalerion maritima]
MADTKKSLALAICDFLKTSVTDGTLPADEKESIETAVECIADSFKVDASDAAATTQAVGSQSLLNIFDAYVKLETAAKSAAVSASTSTQPATELTPEKKKEAEGLKSKGNAAMQQKDFALAVDFYTQALDIHSSNPIYLSNRSAAYHNMKNYEAAKRDAKACTDIDPTYSKGWSRLGLALYALGETRASMEAYQKGMDVEGSGGSDAMRKGFQAAKKRVEELEAAGEIHEPVHTPREDVDVDLGPAPRSGGGGSGNPLADLLGGGGGGDGGSPDFASMMNNPMFQNMAQSMMSNPDMMGQLMTNPRLREMANSFSQGGGLPDMSQLMNDPNIAEIAQSLMGGGGPNAGGPGGAGGAGGAGS